MVVAKKPKEAEHRPSQAERNIPSNASGETCAYMAGLAADAEKTAAAAAAAAEQQKYGDALILNAEGKLTPANFVSMEQIEGSVIIKAHPNQARFADGDPLKVVAAPTGETYTAFGIRMHVYTMDLRKAVKSPPQK